MNRMKSVDVFRFFAIIGIIAIHTTPFNLSPSDENEIYNFIAITINPLARSAVPFLFTISGYFWGKKIRNGYEPIPLSYKMAKRLSTIFLIWCFIYLLPYNLGAFYNYGILYLY